MLTLNEFSKHRTHQARERLTAVCAMRMHSSSSCAASAVSSAHALACVLGDDRHFRAAFFSSAHTRTHTHNQHTTNLGAVVAAAAAAINEARHNRRQLGADARHLLVAQLAAQHAQQRERGRLQGRVLQPVKLLVDLLVQNQAAGDIHFLAAFAIVVAGVVLRVRGACGGGLGG